MSLTNEKKIWDFLKSKGLNDYGCAGLLGNLYAESGLKSNNLQETGNRKLGMTDDEYVAAVDNGIYTKEQFVRDSQGFGICQWTYWSRKKALYEFVKSKNKSIGDLEIQLEYLYKELSEKYPSVLSTLKAATSVLEASNVVLLKFEQPADQSVSVQNKRANYGQEYYDKYAAAGNTKGVIIMGYKTCTKGKTIKLSNNFNSTEFDCHGKGCCTITLINEDLVEYLQKIRDHFGKPITISSGYRCAKHNKNVGGATGSRHAKGDAADIIVKGVEPAEVAKYAESIGIKGIGLYETNADGHFVHIDTRTTKSFWYGQAQAYRSTFGGTSVSNSTTANNKNESTSVVKPTVNETIYVVKKGDSLAKIAVKYGMTYQELAKYNNISNPNIIRVGQKIKIPTKITKIKITANVLNVRAGAGTNYKILTTVKKDSTYELLEEKNGWGRISKGWISSSYYKKM